MESILVVEDDPSIARGLMQNLRFEGYSVQVASDGEAGLALAVDRKPDLVILDVMLPRLNGFEVLRELRRLELDVPVIMLTAKGEEVDKVRGLDLGADDYVTKPFGLAELLARVRSALRRKQQLEQKIAHTRFADVDVDFTARTVTVGGKPVSVTTRELELLRLFVLRAGEALGREEIVRRVWGYDYEGTDRTLDNFVSRLRQKLEQDPQKPRHFLTVRGVGYRFVPEGASEPCGQE
jgi:two-component system, OmpR family, alkaline phosphatase synthesis response regulator PhoP